jgi:hypothetical protein
VDHVREVGCATSEHRVFEPSATQFLPTIRRPRNPIIVVNGYLFRLPSEWQATAGLRQQIDSYLNGI